MLVKLLALLSPRAKVSPDLGTPSLETPLCVPSLGMKPLAAALPPLGAQLLAVQLPGDGSLTDSGALWPRMSSMPCDNFVAAETRWLLLRALPNPEEVRAERGAANGGRDPRTERGYLTLDTAVPTL
mmetsp:Transcript_27414/g.76148  ORF Transcript_27414/g.76148 Transcript_27414/m.76148 type:complete len:127 (+) Transcript_27414:1197-1577(+)